MDDLARTISKGSNGFAGSVHRLRVARGRRAPARHCSLTFLLVLPLQGVSNGRARFPGRRHAFRVTCPGLFSVALSGLQERAHNIAALAISHPLHLVGAAPRGCPSGLNGGGFFAPLVSPAGGGGRRRRPGVDLNPAILGEGYRFVQPHSGLGRWGCPESRDHRLRGRPPVRPGTRCRAGDGAWNRSPFFAGIFKFRAGGSESSPDSPRDLDDLPPPA